MPLLKYATHWIYPLTTIFIEYNNLNSPLIEGEMLELKYTSPEMYRISKDKNKFIQLTLYEI